MNIFIMKKIILLFIATLFASSLYAHKGGTNKEGYHLDLSLKDGKCHKLLDKNRGGG